MAKVRLEDVYDDADDDLMENYVHTKKRKNPLKESDDVYNKNRNKLKTCKLKKFRKQKENLD